MVRGVREGSPAALAGLQMYDLIKELGGVRVNGSDHLLSLVAASEGRTVPLIVLRGGRAEEVMITPVFDAELGRPMMGIEFVDEGLMMPWMHYKRPWDQVRDDASNTIRLLKALVTPKTSKNASKGLGGAPAILVLLWMSIKISILCAFGFVRMLCVNLAILNLLPIPVLDGGHVMFALAEGISRRKANPKVINALVNVFATLLIAAMLYVTVRDFFVLPQHFRDRERNAERRVAATNGLDVTQEVSEGAAGE